MKLPLTLFAILICYQALPQCDQYIEEIKKLPFKEDSTQRFFHLPDIASIKNSDAEIEFRYYRTPSWGSSATCIFQARYNQGSIERNIYCINDVFKPEGENVESIGSYKNRPVWYIKTNKTDVDSNFCLLFKKGLELPDQKSLIDSLKEIGIKIYDHNNNEFVITHDSPTGFNIIEIKVDKKFRNFLISQQTDGYYIFNKRIKIFKDFYNETKLFWCVFSYYFSRPSTSVQTLCNLEKE